MPTRSAPMAALTAVATSTTKRARFSGEPLRKLFDGPVIFNDGFGVTSTLETAQAAVDSGRADLVAFGRAFIANPDLPRRLAEELPLNPPRPESFYGGDAEGYVDYPAYA